MHGRRDATSQCEFLAATLNCFCTEWKRPEVPQLTQGTEIQSPASPSAAPEPRATISLLRRRAGDKVAPHQSTELHPMNPDCATTESWMSAFPPKRTNWQASRYARFVPNSVRTHRSNRLRLQARQRRHRHSHPASLSRTQEHSPHRSLFGADVDALQKPLEGLNEKDFSIRCRCAAPGNGDGAWH